MSHETTARHRDGLPNLDGALRRAQRAFPSVIRNPDLRVYVRTTEPCKARVLQVGDAGRNERHAVSLDLFDERLEEAWIDDRIVVEDPDDLGILFKGSLDPGVVAAGVATIVLELKQLYFGMGRGDCRTAAIGRAIVDDDDAKIPICCAVE